MKIQYLGHSSLSIICNEKHILVDPFISVNPLAASISIDSLKADYILITHAHFDHVFDVEAIATKTNATIIANHEISTFYERKGFKVHGMNFGGSFSFDFGLLKMVNAVHSSSFSTGEYGGNPAGFIISSNSKTIYIAGDTALTMDMKLIPMFFKLDLAILPIGGNYTMDINEAIIASDFVACDKVLGVHYNTSELITIDNESAREVFLENSKELLLLNIGESINL